MISREKIHKILTLVLEISERGEGVNGYPCVHVDVSNIGYLVRLYAMKNGFHPCADWDISMTIDNDSEADQAIKELEELLKIAVDRIGA